MFFFVSKYLLEHSHRNLVAFFLGHFDGLFVELDRAFLVLFVGYVIMGLLIEGLEFAVGGILYSLGIRTP